MLLHYHAYCPVLRNGVYMHVHTVRILASTIRAAAKFVLVYNYLPS